jgi:peptide/nickel transport system ATP-binding protein
VKAVDGVTFKIYKNEIVGIVGESGCGKSTLAKLLIGLVEPPLQYIDGKVLIEGIDLYKLPEKKRRRINGELISYVPQ